MPTTRPPAPSSSRIASRTRARVPRSSRHVAREHWSKHGPEILTAVRDVGKESWIKGVVSILATLANEPFDDQIVW